MSEVAQSSYTRQPRNADGPALDHNCWMVAGIEHVSTAGDRRIEAGC